MTKLLIIGAGRMAEAVISGLVNKKNSTIQCDDIMVGNKSDKERLHYLKNTYSVKITTDWETEIVHSDVLLIASPPETHETMASIIKDKISGQLVITVAAGIDPSYLEKRLVPGTPVCWIMPNTAAQLGQSMSIYTCGQNVSSEHRTIIDMILSSIGEAEELSEQQVHDLTAITGSAPAFFYTFVQALETAAQDYGISKGQARNLVIKMVRGSVTMLENGGEPEELIAQVASPGGSTAKGLEVLEESHFKRILLESVKATNKHARSQGDKV
ncbi:pyrroline-5-carboxylate reductase [Evansella tamaricis]|nr:pyrroline-5-carboxylate reductase [Evansella tamaricis]